MNFVALIVVLVGLVQAGEAARPVPDEGCPWGSRVYRVEASSRQVIVNDQAWATRSRVEREAFQHALERCSNPFTVAMFESWQSQLVSQRILIPLSILPVWPAWAVHKPRRARGIFEDAMLSGLPEL